MFETKHYTVAEIAGDYAYLKLVDEPEAEWKIVARELLPAEIEEGIMIAYEMMQYRIER